MNSKILIFMVLSSTIFVVIVSEPICQHALLRASDETHGVALKSAAKSRARRSTSVDQMRISVFYDASVDKLSSVQSRDVKEHVVPSAVHYWQNVLRVRKSVQNSIVLNRKCENNQYFLAPGESTQYCKNKCVNTKCGEVEVPEEHLNACHTCDKNGRNCGQRSDRGEGVNNTDFVLYVSAINSVQCGVSVGEEASTVAYAAHCQQELDLDRPVAGHINICISSLKSRSKRDELIATLKHELLHALGFSSSLFAYFRDERGRPLTRRESDGKPPINRRLGVRQWSNKVIAQEKRLWKVRSGFVNRTFSLLVTPNVVREVRRHFNCNKLKGAELEDQGGDGTALTHWEKRLFHNEAMTGTVHTKKPVYSRLTLALLEDSGWYLPNYDLADEVTWGKELGCDFALRSCLDLMEEDEARLKRRSSNNVEDLDTKKYPFCNSLMESSPRTSCTPDSEAVGSCNLVRFARSLPKEYQNFVDVEGVDKKDLAKLGSSVTLADFCPYVQAFTWRSSNRDVKPRGSGCMDETNQPDSDNNFALESYGKNARCFHQASPWEQRTCRLVKQWKRFGAGCYNYECKQSRLFIIVNKVSLPCTHAGSVLDVKLKKGEWLHQGSIICPKCEDFCDDCKNSEKEPKIGAEELMFDVERSCYNRQIETQGIIGFFQGFGFNFDAS